MIKIIVRGEPVAQHRPRITTVGKFPRMYKTASDNNYREKLYWEAKRLNMKPIARTIPLRVELEVFRSIPKSFSKKKVDQCRCHIIRPTTKPDIDNYIKQIFDALNGLVWEDDAQIVRVEAGKFYCDAPRLEIIVKENATWTTRKSK